MTSRRRARQARSLARYWLLMTGVVALCLGPWLALAWWVL